MFTRLAQRGAQVVALSPDPANPREQQLLHLARDGTSNLFLYIERLEPKAPHDFAHQWEAKGARRRGVVGEELGRRTIEAVILIPETHQDVHTAWALLRALHPSLLPRTPDTADGLQSGASGQVRIVSVVPSPFYAAVVGQKPSTINDDDWRDGASTSLLMAALSAEAQRQTDGNELNPKHNRLIYVAVSPGITLTSMLQLARVQWGPSLVRFALDWLAAMLLFPIAFLLGRSSTDAARAIEWALLAPVQRSPTSPNQARAANLIKGVRPGGFYRDGVDVGYVVLS